MELPERPVTVEADRTAVYTALMNLLDNAIKYSPSGAQVRVAVAEDPASGEALLEVEDRGPGIPAHETERIFERFYRVDKDRSRALGGTGLGLSIVRNVALAHGGSASVRSVVGEGSTFALRLPLARPRAPDEGAAARPPAGRTGRSGAT
jgi:signal transduction histidine kinase